MKQGFLTPKRRNLEVLAGQTIRVIAAYDRIGTRAAVGRTYKTVLVRDVRHAQTGTLLADHLWFNRGNIWKKADVTQGDRVTFVARAIEYRVGYWGPDRLRQAADPPRVEYRLTPPKSLTVVPADAGEMVTDFNRQQIRARRRRPHSRRIRVRVSVSGRHWRSRVSRQGIRYRGISARRRPGGDL